MIRIVLFLISVLVVAWGFAWVADRPGEIAITWMSYHVETSVIVAAFAVAALVLVILMIWSIVRAILRSPEQVSLFFRHRRAIKGYLAISRGLIAVGAGDLRLARRSAVPERGLSTRCGASRARSSSLSSLPACRQRTCTFSWRSPAASCG